MPAAFIVAIPPSLFIKKTSYKIGIMTGLAFFAPRLLHLLRGPYLRQLPALEGPRDSRADRLLIIGCVILLGTAFILPRHRGCWSSACTS